jgi:hypothetical protein
MPDDEPPVPPSRITATSALRYIVLFSSRQTGELVPPLVPLSQIATANSLYALDPEVVAVLPALRYVLNLPRNALDLGKRSFGMVRDLKQLDLPHDVLLAPWPVVVQISKEGTRCTNPVFRRARRDGSLNA